MIGRNATRNKISRLIDRDGCLCWLCKEVVDTTIEYGCPRAASLDHYVPRKWGGMNSIVNLRLAHSICNHDRENRFPDSMIFRVSEIAVLTNRNSSYGGLSALAKKALRHAIRPPLAPHEIAEIEQSLVAEFPPGRVRKRSHYARRVLDDAPRAYHPDMPIEKR